MPLALPVSLSYEMIWIHNDILTMSTGFDLQFFRVLSINRHPGILHCTFFTKKVSTVIIIEGG